MEPPQFPGRFTTAQAVVRLFDHKGVFHARDGGHPNHAHPPERLPVKLLVEVLDACWVFAEKHGYEIFDRAHHAARFPFERRLAPSIEPGLIRLHAHEDPVAHLRIADDSTDSGNLHDCVR